jgi:alginate O-acetyltransferase complex protein AlgJ
MCVFLSAALCAAAGPEADNKPLSREAQVRADCKAVEQLLARRGGWEAWSRSLREFREAMARRLDERPKPAPGRSFIAKDAPLEGRDGWLFSARRGEQLLFEVDAESEDKTGLKRYAQAEEAILSLHGQLAARGIDLLVVPAPNKSNVYPEQLAPLPTKDFPVQLRSRMLFLRLMRRGVEVVDLQPLFAEHRYREGEPPLYMLRDTHWSPRGARLAAGEIARRLKRIDAVRKAGAGKDRFRLGKRKLTRHGDLGKNWMATGAKAFPKERHTFVSVERTGRADWFDWRSPVLVLGDSYVDYGWDHLGFYCQLAERLNAPVAFLTRPGGGCRMPRELARLMKQGKVKPRAVVWLFTSCSLYETGYLKAELPGAAQPSGKEPAEVRAALLDAVPDLDPATAAYPNALMTLRFRVEKVLAGAIEAKTIPVRFPLLYKRKLLPAAKLVKGRSYRLKLSPHTPSAEAHWMSVEPDEAILQQPWYARGFTPAEEN